MCYVVEYFDFSIVLSKKNDGLTIGLQRLNLFLVIYTADFFKDFFRGVYDAAH